MKTYVVIDWSAKIVEALSKDDEAIDKFRDMVFAAKDKNIVTLDEFDMETGDRNTLLTFSNNKISTADTSMSGIAADMDDERHALTADNK